MIDALLTSLPILLTIALGVFSRRSGMTDDNFTNRFSSVLFNIVSPFLIFSVLYRLSFGNGERTLIFLSVLTLVVMFLGAILVARIIKPTREMIGANILLYLSFAVGSFAYPFIQLNFSNEVFGKVVIADFTLFIAFLTVGYGAAIYFGHGVKQSAFSVFKAIFLTPISISIFGTIVLNILRVDVPDPLIRAASYVGSSFGFMGAFIVGMKLTLPSPAGLVRVVSGFGGRLLISLMIYYLILPYIVLDQDSKIAFTLALFTPFALMSVVISNEQETESEYVTQTVLFALLFYILAYPLIVTLLR